METEGAICIETGYVQTSGGKDNDQHCVNEGNDVGIPVAD